jgi:MFS family permease
VLPPIVINVDQPTQSVVVVPGPVQIVENVKEIERIIEREVEREVANLETELPTPTGNVDETGNWSLISLVLSIAALVMAALTLAGVLRRKYDRYAREDETKEERRERIARMRETGEYGEYDEYTVRKRKTQRVVGIIAAVLCLAPSVAFLLLDNMRLPMGLLNRYTIYVAIAFGVAAVLVLAYLLLGLRKGRKDASAKQENVYL